MAMGAGLGGVVTALLPLVGVVTIWRARARRLRGETAPDPDGLRRRNATLETERRMAAYLASRDTGRGDDPAEDIEQEIRR